MLILTVTYGTRSAPFLALRVIMQLIEDEGMRFPLALAVLKHDTFVDDILFGAHDRESALETRQQLVALLETGKLKARKSSSNCQQLLEGIDPTDHGFAWNAPLNENDTVKILGISWDPTTDSFGFKISIEQLEIVSKLTVLSLLARLFDPMGWISPIIIIGKMFMQQLRREKYSWDEQLPQNLISSITNYFDS